VGPAREDLLGGNDQSRNWKKVENGLLCAKGVYKGLQTA